MHEVSSKTQLSCLALDVQGQVQGVGFRPFVYRLARHHSLKGEIFNHESGAGALLEGDSQSLENFKNELQRMARKPIKIDSLNFKQIQARGFRDLSIKTDAEITATNSVGLRRLHLQPDSSTCPDCWNDYFNPKSRYYGYAFISCSICGPRWTITHTLPFERHHTSYQSFPMCSDCRADYESPQDRRFHAQTVSCPACGPQLKLLGPQSETNLTAQVSKLLSQGAVGAVKGLGGYQLVCDADNRDAVIRLRKLKDRPHQALAVMFKDRNVFKDFGGSLDDWFNLTAPESAVHCLENIRLPLKEWIAPELSHVGCMAPTTPLHHSIMPDSGLLIVTSCNKKSFPIARSLEQVPFLLSNEIDFILDHNREIVFSIDDSVVRNETLLRAARGYTPKIQKIKPNLTTVLALGADLKNSAAVIHSDHLIELPYNGSLSDLDGAQVVKEQLSKQLKLLNLNPEVVLCDRHPNTLSSEINPFSDLPALPVSHHSAHALAVQNPHDKLILTFDGTGINEEFEINGGEAYVFENNHLIHALSMRPMPLVGGDSSIREPWKSLTAVLATAGFDKNKIAELLPELSEEKLSVIFRLALNTQTLHNTSFGRWFDAAAALICFKTRSQTYEAQAPMILESLALEYYRYLQENKFNYEDCLFDSTDRFVYVEELPLSKKTSRRTRIDGIKMLAYLAEANLSGKTNLQSKESLYRAAYHAHLLAAEVTAYAVMKTSENFKFKEVVGTGGVFQNEIFSLLLNLKLQKYGFQFQRPTQQTLNDQSIARGQLLSHVSLKEEHYA